MAFQVLCQMAETNSWHANLHYIWHAILIDVAKLYAKWQKCVSWVHDMARNLATSIKIACQM
jgi:hypothetical protein